MSESEQPPSVQPPHQPFNQPPEGTSPTQPMSATPGLPPAGSPVGPPVGPPFGSPVGSPVGPPATPVQAQPPKTGVWQNATSTSGRRWALALSAGAVALLMVLGVGVAGLLVLRNHDRVGLLANRQDARSFQRVPGDGRVPGADDGRDGRNLPGIPGTRGGGGQGGGGQGLDGLGNVLGGTALHGEVTATVNGSVQTLVFHRGEVTALSATSITLKSSDGFAGTYGRSTATTSRGAAPVQGGQALVLARASDKVALTVIAVPANTLFGPSS